MIPEDTFRMIQQEIKELEAREQVTVLYACESGSRAWGFESSDSDFDVRFIYLRKTEWYLSIQDKRDVIELPIDDELDISGWDLPKALQLLRKSNPPLLEWMQSPIVYAEVPGFADRLRQIMDRYYSPISCMYHYLHMAENNHKKYLLKDEVWTKKYFYVLRPVLACMWIEQGLGVVPIEFDVLVQRLVTDEELHEEIAKLLRLKRSGAELDLAPRNPVLSGFLDNELKRLRADLQPPAESRDPKLLDKILVETLMSVNGSSLKLD